MITKDILTKWRHRLVHAQELYTQAYQQTQDVIREILKEEEVFGNVSNTNNTIRTGSLGGGTDTIIFKPTTKTKGDPLAELLSSMSAEQRTSLITKLEDKK